MKIAIDFQNVAAKVMGEVVEATKVAKTIVMLAREWLKDVTISKEQVKYIVMEAICGGCQGHRAELATVRVAKALASLEGRHRVGVDDLKKAVELVILPRSMIMDMPPDQGPPPPPPPPLPQNQDEN